MESFNVSIFSDLLSLDQINQLFDIEYIFMPPHQRGPLILLSSAQSHQHQ